MTPTADQWIALTRALDPWRKLDLSEMASLYVAPPYSASGHIVRALRSWWRANQGRGESASPPKFMFCGARGSGKSTQLRQMMKDTSREAEVILLDLAPVLPDRPSTTLLVALTGLALLGRLVHWEDASGGVARTVAGMDKDGGFLGALKHFAGDGDIDLPALVDGMLPLVLSAAGVSLGVPAGATSAVRAAVGAVRERLHPVQKLARVEGLMRRLSGNEVDDAVELSRQVSRLAEALQGQAGKPVLVLVDGLDKVPDLDKLLDALEDVDILTHLQLAMVLTGPSNLKHHVRFAGMRQDLRTLLHHNFPVVTQQGQPKPEGTDALLQILQARLGKALAGVVDDAAAREAARASSGLPREFLSILSDAALRAEERHGNGVTLLDVEGAIKELRLGLQAPLTIDDIALLERVRTTASLPEPERAQILLFENLIACYPNDDAWFRPHEVLVRWVESQAARFRELDARG